MKNKRYYSNYSEISNITCSYDIQKQLCEWVDKDGNRIEVIK